MLISLQDDGVLRVYETPADAARDVEALDAEDVFRAVFDENAVPYRIEWIRPNQESSALGLRSVVNGEYRLVPGGSREPARLLAVIRGAADVEPSEFEAAVRDVETRLVKELPP
jgi:hypothetical protein